MTLINHLRRTAAGVKARVVFAEAEDLRIVAAARDLARAGIVMPVLVGDTSSVRLAARLAGIEIGPAVAVCDPQSHTDRAALVGRLVVLRSHKGMTRDTAHQLLETPLAFAAMLVEAGLADACIAGAVHSTREVLRIALDIIGLARGSRLVSSVFLMALPGDRAVTFGDCAVVPYPTAEQLADIAIRSAETHRRLTGETPHVAMLSFSTKGSAEHESVQKVREATRIARALAPQLAIDGELQFDAAWAADVAARKGVASTVAGRANVFVFPNLDAGNIAYKITERLGGAEAIGPILQGLAKPMHDLSRGCKVEDIVTLAAVAALQTDRSSASTRL